MHIRLPPQCVLEDRGAPASEVPAGLLKEGTGRGPGEGVGAHRTGGSPALWVLSPSRSRRTAVGTCPEGLSPSHDVCGSPALTVTTSAGPLHRHSHDVWGGSPALTQSGGSETLGARRQQRDPAHVQSGETVFPDVFLESALRHIKRPPLPVMLSPEMPPLRPRKVKRLTRCKLQPESASPQLPSPLLLGTPCWCPELFHLKVTEGRNSQTSAPGPCTLSLLPAPQNCLPRCPDSPLGSH